MSEENLIVGETSEPKDMAVGDGRVSGSWLRSCRGIGHLFQILRHGPKGRYEMEWCCLR